MEPESQSKWDARLRQLRLALDNNNNNNNSSNRENAQRAADLFNLVLRQQATAHLPLQHIAARGLCATMQEAMDAGQQYYDALRSCQQNTNSLLTRLSMPADCTLEELLEVSAPTLLCRVVSYIYDRFCPDPLREPTVAAFIKMLDDVWHRDIAQDVIAYMDDPVRHSLTAATLRQKLRALLDGAPSEQSRVEQLTATLEWFATHCPALTKATAYCAAVVRAVLQHLNHRQRITEDRIAGNHNYAKRLLGCHRSCRLHAEHLHRIEEELDAYIAALRECGKARDGDRRELEQFVQWGDAPQLAPIDMTLEQLCDSLRDHEDYALAHLGEYRQAFHALFDACLGDGDMPLHRILVRATTLLHAYGQIRLERPLWMSDAQHRAQYNALLAVFLSDIELSREGLANLCPCCATPYGECVGLFAGIDDLITLDAHNVHTLKQLNTLVQLPAIERVLLDDAGPPDVNGVDMVVEESEDDDGIVLGHYDDDDAAEMQEEVQQQSQ